MSVFLCSDFTNLFFLRAFYSLSLPSSPFLFSHPSFFFFFFEGGLLVQPKLF